MVRLRGFVLMLVCLSGPTSAGEQIACDDLDPTQVRLRISVSDVHSSTGSLNITIYPDDAMHFLDGKYKLRRERTPITLPITKVCIAVPGPGNYAVALYHDENDNGHLDTTFIGLPSEGYGFSNNPKLMLSPPSFDRVRVAAVIGDNLIPIRLTY